MTKQTWRNEKLRSANKRRNAHQYVAHCAQLLHITKQPHENVTEEPSSDDCSFSAYLAFGLTLVTAVQAIVAYIYNDCCGATYADILLGGLGAALVFVIIAWWLRPEYKFLNPWVIYDLCVIGVIIAATIELYDVLQDPSSMILIIFANIFSLFLAIFMAAVAD